MSETNGTPRRRTRRQQLKALRLKKQLARERIELARLERQAKLEELRACHAWPRTAPNPGAELLREALTRKGHSQADLIEQARKDGKQLTEGNFIWDWVSGYQDLIDRLRSPDGLLLSAISIAADRQYGSYWPFFRTWSDLALLRGASRIVYQTSCLARGAVGGVASYIIGDGFKYRVVEKESGAPGLQAVCQDILNENSDLNDWPAIEHSCVMRDSRDGEWYLRDFPQQDGTTLTRWIEPEQLIQPADSTLAEWSFGKRNPVRNEAGEDIYDVQRTLAYNACYDGNNSHGVDLDARHVIEHNNNVDATVKRGIPDLAYDTYDFLKVASRLLENAGEGAAIQASIAMVRQWESPVTADQASDFVTSDADYQETNPWTGEQQSVRRARPGTVEDVPKGMSLVDLPWGKGSASYIAIEQALLSAVAITWNAPKWLLSNDTDLNYASSLTAESPFVKTGTHRQHVWYRPRFLRARWRVLRNYCAAKGGIVANGRRYSYEEVRRFVNIQCEPPSMEVRNKADEAQANAVRVQGGWKSPQTVAQEEGLDWEQERGNIEQYREELGAEGPPLPLPGDDQGGGLGGLGTVEQWLREEGFTGIDKHGHKWVNGQQVKRGGPQDKGKAAAGRQAAVAKVQQQLAGDIKQMAATPEGKQTLARGRQLAQKVKSKVADGVKSALDGIDAESGGGLSLLAGALKGKDAKAAALGASKLVSTVYSCVHEEMFELMLGQQTGGPAFVAKLAARGAAKLTVLAESGLFKAATWAWGRMRGTGESIDWTLLEAEMATLTDADKELLDQLAGVAADALRELFAAAGVDPQEVTIDQDVLAQRLTSMLST